MNDFVKELLTRLGCMLLAIIMFGSLFGFMIWIDSQEQKAQDLACKRIGFKRWERNMGQDYCEDLSYNLHYVKIINTGDIFDWKYIAVKISIGDVTTKHDAYRDLDD